MERGTKMKILSATVLIIMLIMFFHWTSSISLSVKQLETWKDMAVFKVTQQTSESTNESGASTQELYKMLKQRNEISTLLNEMRKQIGQLQCEKNKGHTSDQGGWCKTASTETGGNHLTDAKLIPVLSNFLKGKTVASFGDGPGAYKREILKLGEVASYDAYDGAPFCEQTSEGRVTFLDLSVPQYGLPAYDWVMSLEVAEHIPQKYEETYLDNIFRHAKEGIILSWAVPGQGGLQHINNRPLTYVIDVMNKHGFEIDREKSKILQDGATFGWLRQNTHVYVRSETPKSKFALYI